MKDFNTAKTYLAYAIAQIQTVKEHEVESIIRRGLRLFPNDIPLLNLLGTTLMRHPSPAHNEEARKVLEMAHRAKPDNLRYGVDYALILGHSYETAEAAEGKLLAWYDARHPGNPDNTYVLGALADFYYFQKDFYRSRVCYSVSAAGNPEDHVTQKRIKGMHKIYKPDIRESDWDLFLRHRREVITKQFPPALAKFLAPEPGEA